MGTGERTFQMVCVVAMARNRVIGDGRNLIWHLPDDLQRVKRLTMGCPLIMGRRTFESIGRALPGRLSVVLTRNASWQADGAVTAGSLEAAVAAGKSWLAQQQTGENRLILFGGGQIYEAGLPYCQMIEATFVDVRPAGGVKFPVLAPTDWTDECLEIFAADGDRPGFSCHRLIRTGPARKLL